MNYKDLLKNIDNEKDKVYLIYGEEAYRIDSILDYFKNKLEPAFRDFNLTVIDDKVIDIDRIIENFESVPFMDKNRIVVIKSSEFFKTGTKGLAKEDEKKLLAYLENPAETTIVLFCPPEVDKRSSLFKLLKKNHCIFEANKLEMNELKLWCKAVLKKSNTIISDLELESFIEKTGYYYKESGKNLRDLENELVKISALYQKQGKITIQDIDLVILQNFENNVFRLIEDTFSGDFKKALIEFNHIIDSGESALMILTMFGKQLSMITKYHILKAKGYNEALIAQKLSVHPYALKKAGIHSQKLKYKEALVLLNLCLDTDYRIKNGQINERIGVELILTKICQRIKTEKPSKVFA